ncbi:MAG: hypothetical protein VX112_04700 [Pseudomonadota bacterium]|nr:hypothetical protein [Pseudomonadota bacterium]
MMIILATTATLFFGFTDFFISRDWKDQDVSSTFSVPLVNLPPIFTTIISLPSFFSVLRMRAKPWGMLRPQSNTFNQGFDFSGESVSYSYPSGVQDIYYHYPADVQVKPFGFVVLGFLSVFLLPAGMIYLLEVGVTSLANYAVLGCNKLFGSSLQPFYNLRLLSMPVGSILAHVGWVVISVPTSVATLLVRTCQQVVKGVASFIHAASPRSGLTNLASSINSSMHASQVRSNVERQPLLQCENARVNDAPQSADQVDATRNTNHMDILNNK